MLGALFAGMAPGLALLAYFYLKDKYEPEPLSRVFLIFISGAILVLPTSFIENILESTFQSESVYVFSSGMLEELFKWSILIIIAFLDSEFDDFFDGIVYGSAVSLGFATAENIMYLMSYGLEYALNRALMPVSSHALFGVIMGYYVSKAKFTTRSKSIWLIQSILIPSILHGIFNYILISQKFWLVTMLLFMVFLWWLGIRKVQMAEVLSKNHNDINLAFKKL